MNTEPLQHFFAGLGYTFGGMFLLLSFTWTLLILRRHDLAAEAKAVACLPVAESGAVEPHWRRLVTYKANLAVLSARAEKVSGAIPVLALVGTALGMFFALTQVVGLPLGSINSVALLQVLLDSGAATALATTAGGNIIYVLMELLDSTLFLPRSLRAEQHLDAAEALAVKRLGGAPDAAAPDMAAAGTAGPVLVRGEQEVPHAG